MPSTMKILIVEDETLYRETLATMVSGLGYEVATAETGREALENVLFQGSTCSCWTYFCRIRRPSS